MSQKSAHVFLLPSKLDYKTTQELFKTSQVSELFHNNPVS